MLFVITKPNMDSTMIDLIDGVAPVDINDLFTKLAALFA